MSKLSIVLLDSDVYHLYHQDGITEEGGLSLIAHSMGCLVAIKFALDHPDLVNNLVPMGSTPSPLLTRGGS